MKKCIVLDVSNLAYRALHTVGSLTHPDRDTEYTGTIFQLWQTCLQLERVYNTPNFAFAFDSRKSIRQEAYPPYKQKRRTEREAKEALDPKAKRERQGMHRQIDRMPQLLTRIGALNIFGQTGYEADDMIGSIVASNPNVQLVIVSTDADLYQLLRPGVVIYNPVRHDEITEDAFRATWDISPIQWASVKAWTGCASDNVEGIPGVAEKTAIKWLNGQIKPENKKYELFSNGLDIYTRNKPLVTLPYPGTQANVLQEQPPRRLNWNLLAETIGSTNYVPEGIVE